MSDGPRVGPESDEYRAVCVYSLAPGEPQCSAPATLHVAVDSDTYGIVSLATCNTHAPTARAASRYLEEHAFEGYCGLPGTRWSPKNVCVLDDSGREPARAAKAAGTGR